MTLELQPLFPLAVAQVQLRLDPLELAVLMQEVLALRGAAEGNPEQGCAWTGDINGIWQLHRLQAFAGVTDHLRRHSWSYLEQLGFEPGRLYELSYAAESPQVAGLGFVAVRDMAAWMRHGAQAGPVRRVYAFGSSQSGRFLRTFLYQASKIGRAHV